MRYSYYSWGRIKGNMQETRPGALVFPTRERAQRLRTGGILYFILGGILLGVGWLLGDSFFQFPGFLLLVVGFLVSGYKKQVVVDPGLGVVDTTNGFYIFIRRASYQGAEFLKVLIRKSTRLSSKFTRIPNQTYRRTVKTSYEVILAGVREVKVDATKELHDAEEWARQIADALNLPVEKQEGSPERKEKAARATRMMRWMPWLILMVALGLMVYVIYMLISIG